MGLTSFSPSHTFSNSFPLLISQQPRYLYNPRINIKSNISTRSSPTLYVSNVARSYQVYYMISYSSKQIRGSSLVAFGAKHSGSNNEDHRALEAVLRLYSAIENRNLNELSDVIAEECQCVCNFFSAFQSFRGKKQVMDFFSFLMRKLGNNIEFVVQPILSDGMNVGVSWRLEWKNTHFPLGKGFSFHICHIYQGKLFIRNVEMFIEPLLNVEPLRLKIMGFILNLVDKMGSKALFKARGKRAVYILFSLFFMAALLFCLRLSLD